MPDSSYVWIPHHLPRKHRAAELGTSLYPTRLRSSQKTTEVKKTYRRIKFQTTMGIVGALLYPLIIFGSIMFFFRTAWVFATIICSVFAILFLLVAVCSLAEDGLPISPHTKDSKSPIAVETRPAIIGRHERFAALYATIVSTPGAMTALAQEWAETCDLAEEATLALHKGTEDPAVLAAYDTALQRCANHITASLHSIDMTDEIAERAQSIINRVPAGQLRADSIRNRAPRLD